MNKRSYKIIIIILFLLNGLVILLRQFDINLMPIHKTKSPVSIKNQPVDYASQYINELKNFDDINLSPTRKKINTDGIKNHPDGQVSKKFYELTDIPDNAIIISNTSHYIKELGNLVYSWNKQINLGQRIESSNVATLHIPDDTLSRLNPKQRYDLQKHLLEKFIIETNFKKKFNLPEIEFGPVFNILNHLRLEEDFVLDYLYYYDIMSGIPMIYARGKSIRPLNCLKENPDWEQYLVNMHFEQSLKRQFSSHIVTDQTPEGYFQLALYSLYCDQFYRVWHSLYRDETIVTTKKDLVNLSNSLGMNTDNSWDTANFEFYNSINNLDSIDISPYVLLQDQSVLVAFYYFTYWGGLMKVEWTINRTFPHHEIKLTKTTILKFEPDIIY